MSNMQKENIIKTSINLFAHYGIKGVSMSQIAGALRISKKTLYEHFENKEELVLACIDSEKERIKKMLSNTEKEANNTLEALMLAVTDLYQYKLNFCPSFEKDLKKYPEIQQKILSGKQVITNRYLKYFYKGIEEGFFIPDFDYERISEAIMLQLGELKVSIEQPYLMLTLLRGVCTKKGIDTLNNIVPVNIHRYS